MHSVCIGFLCCMFELLFCKLFVCELLCMLETLHCMLKFFIAVWKLERFKGLVYIQVSTWMHNFCLPEPGLLLFPRNQSFYHIWQKPASLWPVESCIHIQETLTVIIVTLELLIVMMQQEDGHQATPGQLLLFDPLALWLVVFKVAAQASLSPQNRFYLPRFLQVS